jgi:phage terminase large subunit
VLHDRIEHESGGKFKFHGMARDPDGIQSMQGFDIAWIEEAQVISERSLTKLTPTFRKMGAEIWMTANPQRAADVFSVRFIENFLPSSDGRIQFSDAHMRIRINYYDNPWYHLSSLEIERRDAYETLPRALYDHIWLGHYNDSVDNSIILAEWYDAAIDAHKKKKWDFFGKIVVTHDPADTNDARATLAKHGNIITGFFEDKNNDINDSCAKACEFAREQRADAFIYDADGCGLGLRGQVHDYFDSKVEILEFRGGATAENPDEEAMTVNGRIITNRQYFFNLRAQKYFQLAERFRKTYQAIESDKYIHPHELISIDAKAGDLASLKSELTSVSRKFNSGGNYQLLSKVDMKKLLQLKSPNMGDCTMMAELSIIDFNDMWKSSNSDGPDLDFA